MFYKNEEIYEKDSDETFFYQVNNNISNEFENKEFMAKPNSRLKTTYKFNKKYASDINILIDIGKIRNNLSKFKLINKLEGYTSNVEIYELGKEKIIKKIYKKNGVNPNFYTDLNFLIESYNNELEALKLLQDELYFPKIITYDIDELSITMNYVGDMIEIDKNIDLTKIPENWKQQLYYILMILKKHNIYHNDITGRNICLKDNKLTLIDYGNCKKHIDTYYRNFDLDILNKSEDINDFLKQINTNAYNIRKCLHGYN